MNKNNFFTTLILTLILALAGCSALHETRVNLFKKYPQEYHLQRVAKDWCMTIRASQVMPVYPLTEDLQPGDVFLVQETINNQQKEYNKDGFLQLDSPLARIQPSGYENFYQYSFPYVQNDNLPNYWINNETSTTLWHKAPLAAFPTYSFSVRSGGGGNIAVPVKGVPVALSYLNANAAEGTISISKAYTYGVDQQSLYNQVKEDLEKNDSKFNDFLKKIISEKNQEKNDSKKKNEEKYYLRVVSRVYLAKEMDISLYSTTKGAGGVSAGAPKPVDLFLQETRDKKSSSQQTLQDYTSSIGKLNEMLAGAIEEKNDRGNILPGGTLKVTAVSDRSVSMKETFARPLVIGYLGFDIPITLKEEKEEKSVILRSMIPTMKRLENRLK